MRSRHQNPARMLIVDGNATIASSSRTLIARPGYEVSWPHLLLELYLFACANGFTRLSVLPALKTVYPRHVPGRHARAARLAAAGVAFAVTRVTSRISRSGHDVGVEHETSATGSGEFSPTGDDQTAPNHGRRRRRSARRSRHAPTDPLPAPARQLPRCKRRRVPLAGDR